MRILFTRSQPQSSEAEYQTRNEAYQNGFNDGLRQGLVEGRQAATYEFYLKLQRHCETVRKLLGGRLPPLDHQSNYQAMLEDTLLWVQAYREKMQREFEKSEERHWETAYTLAHAETERLEKELVKAQNQADSLENYCQSIERKNIELNRSLCRLQDTLDQGKYSGQKSH